MVCVTYLCRRHVPGHILLPSFKRKNCSPIFKSQLISLKFTNSLLASKMNLLEPSSFAPTESTKPTSVGHLTWTWACICWSALQCKWHPVNACTKVDCIVVSVPRCKFQGSLHFDQCPGTPKGILQESVLTFLACWCICKAWLWPHHRWGKQHSLDE